MSSVTVVKTIGSTGVFSTLALWESGAPADLTTAEKSAAGTFAVAAFVQGESLTFVGSGATGKFLDTDSTGAGNGTYITYGITTGNPTAGDVVTGGTSGATCILSSSTPLNVGVIWQGQCQNQEFTSASNILTISGSTAGVDAYKHLTTVAGASFRDNIGSSPLRYNVSNGCGIRKTGTGGWVVLCFEAYARLSNLQIQGTSTTTIALPVDLGGLFENLICEGVGVSTDIPVAYFPGSEVVRNSLFVMGTTGVAAECIVNSYGGSPFFYNCTFACLDDRVSPDAVLRSDGGGTVTVQNCGLFAGDTGKAVKSGSGTFNFTTCFSDISGTTGVTQTAYAGEFLAVNDSNRDFRLKTGAAQIDSGTTDATNAGTDIIGTARPQGGAYDVGCWEGGVQAAFGLQTISRSVMGW